MAVPTYTQIETLYLDDLQANVTVNKPVTTGANSEASRDINDAYATIWELSGGAAKRVTGVTAWSPAPTVATDGRLDGLLTDINEPLHLWATQTAGSTGGITGQDFEMYRVEPSEIEDRRRTGTGLGYYTRPKLYSIVRKDTATPADVGKPFLYVWPGLAGWYFPLEYVPQFAEIDPVTITTPNVTDIEARDIAHYAALMRCMRIGRAEFMPEIAARISSRTSLALERRRTALLQAKQDK